MKEYNTVKLHWSFLSYDLENMIRLPHRIFQVVLKVYDTLNVGFCINKYEVKTVGKCKVVMCGINKYDEGCGMIVF